MVGTKNKNSANTVAENKLSLNNDTKETTPKRGKSAYLFFCNDERANVMEIQPNLKGKEITTELAIRWNYLKENNPEKLQKYESMALEDKLRYQAEKSIMPKKEKTLKKKQQTVSETVSENLSTKRKSKKSQNLSNPKRGKSSYLFFCSDERKNVLEQCPQLKVKEITIELANRWKQLKETNVDRLNYYENLSKQDRDRYETEKQTLKALHQQVDKEPKKSKKLNGFQLFSQDNRNKIDAFGKSAKEVTEQLTLSWKSLSKNEQEEYKLRAQNM